MENRFNNNDFEHFVKQNADQYRMFPSDKVWKGIHNTLHTRRRWYGIGLAFLLLTTGVVTWVMLIPSAKNRQVATTLPKAIIQQPVMETKPVDEIVIVPAKASLSKNSFTISADELKDELFSDNPTGTDIADNNTTDIASAIPAGDLSEILSIASLTPIPVTNRVEVVHQPESKTKTAPTSRQVTNNNKSSYNSLLPVRVNDYSFSPVKAAANKEDALVTKSEETIVKKEELNPFTIESVINSYKFTPKRKRMSFQVYVTPTISYRELKESNPVINYSRNSITGLTTSYYAIDINSVVTHKPDIGLQLGFSAGYPLSKKIKVIGGLQFNVSKYDIKAYTHPSEIATINLSAAAGSSNTLSTPTNYRNAGGSRANWLHNLYFSASAPIGLEVKLMGKRKAHIGMSGTVQPTYIISNRSYLISTDYKNYAEVPSLTRKWNINTGFELFAGYTTGNVSWRVGPQIRYQAMSSFENKYPIKEHLFDFGLKLGVMLSK